MANYRIPKEEKVLEALRRAVANRKVVDSQELLRTLVSKALGGEEGYRVSRERLRRLAVSAGIMALHIHCRESGEVRTLRKCPVCSGAMKKLRNATVFGGTVTVGFRCGRCGYWSGIRRRIPVRYIFTRRKR